MIANALSIGASYTAHILTQYRAYPISVPHIRYHHTLLSTARTVPRTLTQYSTYPIRTCRPAIPYLSTAYNLTQYRTYRTTYPDSVLHVPYHHTLSQYLTHRTIIPYLSTAHAVPADPVSYSKTVQMGLKVPSFRATCTDQQLRDDSVGVDELVPQLPRQL
eukprot:1411810-Rhodomonas_salina.1